ncbi:MAG: tetratricopeptide repeat protein [Phycisphaerales bacterium]|jgi:tetratricopeptide (TPR) repeat protein|nr:tetratricopeptide repeat protein [Phycisphaerales bacterium]
MKQFILAAVCVFILGCTGPSKVGKVARQKAHDRMDLVNADLASQQARQQFEVGQLSSALSTIGVAITRYPEKAEYHQLRGRILLEQHKLDDAKKSFELASSLNPESAHPQYLLGVLYQRWGDDEAALQAYSTASENDESHAQFFLAKAETLVSLDRIDEAIALLHSDHTFKHQASIPALLGQIYLRIGNPSLAAQYLADSKALGNDDLILVSDLIVAQFQAGLYAECLMTFREFEMTSETALTSLQRRIKGKSLAATGRLIEGRDVCLTVTRESPQDADAWIDLGYISWKMGDYRRLKQCGSEICTLTPSRVEGPLFLGIAAKQSGNVDLAAQSFATAQSLAENGEIAHWIATASEQLGGKNAIDPQEVANMPAKTAEILAEEPILGLVEGSEPMVTVPQQLPQYP